MRRVAIVSAAILSVACGIPSLAQMGDFSMGDTIMQAATHPAQPALPDESIECMTGPSFPFEELKGTAELKDSQHQAIYQIECKYLAQIEPAMTQLKANGRQLKSLLTAPAVDAKAVADLQAQINQQRMQISNLFLQQQLESVQVLTADQRNALQVAMIKQHPHGRHWW